MDPSDDQLWEACRRLPSDWEPHGRRKWPGEPEGRPGCDTCRWFLGLLRASPDWGACANPDSSRAGLLTHIEQGCWHHEPKDGQRREHVRPVHCGFAGAFERCLRERAAEFIRDEVRRANDPEPEDRPRQRIREAPLLVILRRLLRHAEEDFLREAVEEIAARARWDSWRQWESARRRLAREVGLSVPEVRMPGNVRELEDRFWRRVGAIIEEAFRADSRAR